MKDYYNLFVELSLQQCTMHDYSDKKKVKRHNAAAQKLDLLQAEMKEIDCTNLLNELLRHDDDRVKLNAASLCLSKGILINEAKQTLNRIINFSEDSTMCFCAKMILQTQQ